MKEVCVWDLEPHTKIKIQTKHNTYNIETLDKKGSILIQGGKYFPTPTEATFSGSILHGVTKFGNLVCESRMEVVIRENARVIITSAIQDIQVHEKGI